MIQENLFDIILSTHVSEKSTTVYQKDRTVVFKVASFATKENIKNAVESCLNVKVENVRTCNVKGKRKVFRQKEGRRKSWKKAYVVLQEGSQLELMQGE